MRLPIEVHLPPNSATSSSAFAVDPSSRQPMLIELQGSLETGGEGSTEGATIGKLDLSQPSRPQLLIAHHLLTGKLVKLDKPLAVLKHTFPASAYNGDTLEAGATPAKKLKVSGEFTSSPEAFRNQAFLVPPKTPAGDGPSALGASSSPLPSSPATPAGTVELREGTHEIIGIIRHKLLFNKRPENIVNLDALGGTTMTTTTTAS